MLLHKHSFEICIGHTENVLFEHASIRLHLQCKCGKRASKRYSMYHPMVDEEAYPSCYRSGYSWWMHNPLKLNTRTANERL